MKNIFRNQMLIDFTKMRILKTLNDWNSFQKTFVSRSKLITSRENLEIVIICFKTYQTETLNIIGVQLIIPIMFDRITVPLIARFAMTYFILN